MADLMLSGDGDMQAVFANTQRVAPMQGQGGVTYLGLLFLIAFAGILASTTGVLWSSAQQRWKERELLFVGNEFRRAIQLYYQQTPGTVKRYPAKLEDLLKDTRQLTTQRYLRRLYNDPMTSSQEWGLVEAPGGGIMGVYSKSTATPFKQANFKERDADFEKAKIYADWKFVYVPILTHSPMY